MVETNIANSQPVSDEYLEKMNAYWRAANYLGAAQLYLLDNPLLREPLMEYKMGEHIGLLLVYELPDTVKQQRTEAQAYAAVWDIMMKLQKDLPRSTSAQFFYIII